MSNPDLRAEVTIDLQFPIEVDGQKITKLTMRRPKLRDTVKHNHRKDNMDRGIAILADLCDLAPEHLHELDELDFDAVQSQYESFRGGGK